MQILIGMVALALYGAMTFYIGWCFKRWLQALSVYRWPVIYWGVLFFVAFSPMLGMGIPAFSFLRNVGY